MTVGMVTARSGGGLQARQYFPRAAGRIAAPRVAATALSRAATSRLALLLLGRASPLPVAALIAAWVYYNRISDPPGFPGFDALTPGWRKPTIGHIYTPGDYVPNPFDHGAFDNPPESLLDTADSGFPQGIRYWGDFGVEPYPDPRPGLNWPSVVQAFPSPIPSPRPTDRARPAGVAPITGDRSGGGSIAGPRRNHQVLPNLVIGANDLITDETGIPDNIAIIIALPSNLLPITRSSGGLTFTRDSPRRKQREKKLRPRNMLIWWVIKKMVDAAGGAKEFVDIFAEAADFKGWKERVRAGFVGVNTPPKSITDGRHENLLAAFYLFQAGGMNNLDLPLLAQLLLENEAEDFIFGAVIGRASKFTAQRLDMLFGVQTGALFDQPPRLDLRANRILTPQGRQPRR